MAELTDARLAALLPVHRIAIPGTDDHVYVRTLTAADVDDLAAFEGKGAGEALQAMFLMLICDESGQRRYVNGTVPDWPLSLVKVIVETGMDLNGLNEEVTAVKKRSRTRR